MGIASMARADVAALLADTFSDLVVSVKVGETEVNGNRVAFESASDLTDAGEVGITSGAVRVAANAVSLPGKGDTIEIDDVECFCMGVDMDAAGAFWVIRYSQQKTSE